MQGDSIIRFGLIKIIESSTLENALFAYKHSLVSCEPEAEIW